MEEDENLILLAKKAGLNQAQADTYIEFIKNGKMTPGKVAELTNESRSNSYMICEKLEKFGLIKKTADSKLTYQPNHPMALETLAEKRRKILTKNEKIVKEGLDSLIDIFYANNQMPGSRTIYGKDAIKEVYKDILRVGEDYYFFRTPVDVENVKEEIKDFLDKKIKKGIHTYAITVEEERSLRNYKTNRDEKRLMHRTFILKEHYTSPVEIDVYGDKVAFSSFGEIKMVTFINSPLIAESMRQIMKLIIELQKSYMAEKFNKTDKI